MTLRPLLVVLCALLAAGAAHAAGLAAGGPVDITADRLDVRHAEGKATFSGNVTVVQNGFSLKAPSLTATYGQGGEGDVKDLTATGGVTIKRGDEETATGTTAVYQPGSQKLVLTGAVTLVRGPSQLSGDKLVYDIASGNAQVTNSAGPVKARFVPQGK